VKFITIDGTDKSGKSSIIEGIWKETNGLVYPMDRGLSSWHFFNVLLERIPKEDKVYHKEYKQKLKAFRQLVDLSVILSVNEEDWKTRCKEAKEQPLVGNLSFEEHQKELIHYFNKARYSNVLRLNTSELSEDECVNKILARIGYNRRK